MLRVFWLSLLIIACAVAPELRANPADKLPVAAFAELPFVERSQLSPDGSRIAGLLGVGGVQNIAIINLFNKTETKIKIPVPAATQALWIRWVNDDNIIVGLSALLPVENENWYVTRALAINRVSGKVTKLLWEKNGQDTADVL